MDATPVQLYPHTAWHWGAVIINLLVITLMAVLVYLTLKNRSYLYGPWNSLAKKIKLSDSKPITWRPDMIFRKGVSEAPLVFDDDGNITNSLEQVVSYLGYTFINEWEEINISSILAFFKSKATGANLDNALYRVLPAILLHTAWIKTTTNYKDYLALITFIVNTLATDLNTRSYETVVLYLVASEYDLEAELSDAFVTACTNLNKVQTFSRPAENTDKNVVGFYPEGNLAQTSDELTTLKRIVPYLLCINKYVGTFSVSNFDSIITAHTKLGTTLLHNFLTVGMYWNPLMHANSDSNIFNHILLALEIQVLYPVLDSEDVTKLLEAIQRSVPDNYAENLLLYSTCPTEWRYADERKAPCVFNPGNAQSTIATSKHLTDVEGIYSTRSGNRSWAPALDVPYINLLEKYKIWPMYRVSETNWNDTASEQHQWMKKYPKMAVTATKYGSDINASKSMQRYCVLTEDTLSTLCLYSNVSSASADDFTVGALVSDAFPNLQAGGPGVQKTDAHTIQIAPSTPFSLTVYQNYNQYIYNYQCVQAVVVTFEWKKEDQKWLIVIKAPTLGTFSVKQNSSTVKYRYCSSTVTAYCKYAPAKIPQLLVAPFQLESNVLRYNNFNGQNALNILTKALNNNLFITLGTVPTLTNVQLSGLDILDPVRVSGLGDVVYNADEVPLISVENKLPQVTNDRIGTASPIFLHMVAA